ncbi:unnamed protein product [Caenorhabditis sp. 36 PRJEB53466]|nr:unnamed protein product [Caenorhabditis sp. 36 PRJEB53466]
MSSNPIFWHSKQNCPVVYVAGIFFRHKATYGIVYREEDARNESGSVSGQQNELRAELTGLKRILEQAISHKIASLVIRAKPDGVYAELDRWENADSREKNAISTIPIFSRKIHELCHEAKDYLYWLEEIATASSCQTEGYHKAATLATRRGFKFDKVHTVAICGACAREGQDNPRATYGIYWGDGDIRNKSGQVGGKQTSLRGEVTALIAATRMSRGLTRIQVLTRSPHVAMLINSRDSEWRSLANEELCKAKTLAKDACPIEKKKPIEEQKPVLMPPPDTDDEDIIELVIRPPKFFKKSQNKEASMMSSIYEKLDNLMLYNEDQKSKGNAGASKKPTFENQRSCVRTPQKRIKVYAHERMRVTGYQQASSDMKVNVWP